jgi:hypothetical protein
MRMKIYRHYKGGLYRLLYEALREDDETLMAVYQSLEDGCVWVRPWTEFKGVVEVDGLYQSRFKFIWEDV